MAYVWGTRIINLSGKSFTPNKSKAKNASNLEENGENGKDGSPGESSGNLTMLVKRIVNPSNLKAILIGGRGEDGQDGGNGFDGPDGIGITKDELEKLCVKYKSLFWDSWRIFRDYKPPDNWKKDLWHFDKKNQFVFQTYIEEGSGRKIEFSYGGFRRRWYEAMTYDLYFAVIGSNGKNGTQGGSNGVGGEGGYFGNAKIEDPETGERFSVNVVSKLGENGTKGVCGKNGKNGIKGNDMVIIDRSVLGGSRKCLGKGNIKITFVFQYTHSKNNRFNGYSKHVSKSPACFVHFSTSEIDKAVVSGKKASERTERTSYSKAVAKQSIISEQLLAEANGFFESESQFSSDACKEIMDEKAEEEQETIMEQIVLLKQKSEESVTIFTSKGAKRTCPKFMVYSLVERILKTGRNASVGEKFQNLVDLFSIEIPFNQLNKIKLYTLFQKIDFLHAIKESKMICVVLAAQQDLLQNGKTYSEIVNFAGNLTVRRREKNEFSKFSNDISKIMKEFEKADCQVSGEIDETSEILVGVKQKNLVFGRMDFIDAFFENFTKYKTNLKVLEILNNFLKKVDPSLLQTLCENAEDGEEFENHLNEISAWKKQQIKEQKRKADDSSYVSIEPLRNPSDLELKFVKLVNEIHENSTFWNSIFEPMNSEDVANDLRERYGDIPRPSKQSWARTMKQFTKESLMKFGNSFFTEKVDYYFDAAKFVLRIFKEAESVLIFNRRLYYLNWLMKIDQGKITCENLVIDNGISNNFDDFLKKFENLEINVDGVECQNYMNEYGMGCAPTRYLFSQEWKVQVISFVKSGYQQLKKIEQFKVENPRAAKVFWIDNKTAFGIEPDENYRDLMEAIKKINEKHSEKLKNEMKKFENDDFYSPDEIKLISSFFDKEYESTVEEWIENFLAITGNQKLLSILKNRFFIDGNHLSVYEFQFILFSVAKLLTKFRCPINFLLLAICSVSQNEIINVVVYLQILFHQSSRFQDDSRIYKALQLVSSVKNKSLLVLKMFQHKGFISAEQFYSLLLMLQHATSGAEQLENIELTEWINIATRQKWSEFTGLFKKYGEVGYYLGILDGKGKNKEEKLMRNVFDSVVCIPERLIALITHFIEDNELVADETYFEKIKTFLLPGKEFFSNLKITGDVKLPYLVTNEKEQDQLITFLMDKCPEDVEIIPRRTRSIDDVANLITGIHDKTDEEKENRRNETKHIADLLKIFEYEQEGRFYKNFEMENKTKIAETLSDKKLGEQTKQRLQILLEFDNALFKIKKKWLRHTQKMAILFAVENDKHLLEQVNTGEGKTFIIAAIAIIRRKTGHRSVDVITSSPVLAERDSEETKLLYQHFNLTVAHNCEENPEKRKKCYQCDVVYGDISRFQRDYLLHTFYKKDLLGSRTRNCVIVDEVDNMLLDNGNNMLYLSHNIPGLHLLDSLLIFIYTQVHKPIYNGMKKDLDEHQASFDNEKIKDTVLTDIFGRLTLDDVKKLASIKMEQKTIQFAYEKLISKNVIDSDGYLNKIEQVKDLFVDEVFSIRLENTLKIISNRKREIVLPNYLKSFVKLHLDELIRNCKNSMFLNVNEEYVVDVDRTGGESSLEQKVTIIDSNTGVDLATSQWNGGLHQFLQLKHCCRLSPISLKAVFISNVAYLKGYQQINGLTGTLGSVHESKTFIDLYGADLIKIPTFKPKFFYEKVAVVSTREDEWFQSLFDEVCDQVSAKKSVLIVSDSISTVEKIALELKNRYEKLDNPSDEIRKCFESIVKYEREHEDFVFNEEHPLDTSRLIIATNLAGRGTDIKLSKDLIGHHGLQDLIGYRGLHVIASFLPSNCRIEEQAFGRAARCGEPGSAQIIALRPDESGSEQSIFQLKMFRDNQEVHRLASLKSYYDFHTEIEEKCLEKFREHCSTALNHVYSSNGVNNEDSLPTPSQVVYFAILDKWALWLDSKSSLIDLCAKNRKESEKESIIESVEEFLKDHPFGTDKTCFEVAKEWVDAPQSLINIGIIQMNHDNGFKAAEDTFNKILMNENEFTAEVCYYKACMRMIQWKSIRNKLNSMKINELEDYNEELTEAMQLFHKSRTFFTERILRKQKEGKIVVQFSQNVDQANNSGFSAQLEAIITAYQLIIDNIDWIIGRPVSEETFLTSEIDEDYTKKVYESFVRQGVICPSVINNDKLEKWQLDSLRHVFKLSKNDVIKMLDGMRNDSRIECYDDYHVFNKQIMMAHVKLPHRVGFWTELDQMEVFNRGFSGDDETTVSSIQQILVVDPNFESELPEEFKQIKAVLLSDDEEDLRYQIRLSNGKAQGIIYDWKDVEELHFQNPENNLMKKLETLISEKKAVKDHVAQINFERFSQIGYCQRFDGITISEAADYFQIEDHAAGWILATLTDSGVLTPQTDLFYQFNHDENFWNQKIGIFLEKKKAAKENSNDSKDVDLDDEFDTVPEITNLNDYAEALDSIRKMPNLKNISPELIQKSCKIEGDKKLIEFFKLLLNEQILVPYKFTRFRLTGKLDCLCLPSSISDEVLKFLNDRFAYSFAVETLSYALDQSAFNPTVSKQILLPEDPHKDLEHELKRLGIILPPRICTRDHYMLNRKDYKHFDIFKAIINENRSKLLDLMTSHMQFASSTAFFHSREHLMDVETKAIVKNGFPMLIMPKQASSSWKASVFAIGLVGNSLRWTWSGVKAAVNAICSFGASVVRTCVEKVVDSLVGEYAVKGGRKISKAILETANAISKNEIYKAANERVKSGVSLAANAVLNVADKTSQKVGNALIQVGTVMSSAAEYVASTKMVQMAKSAVNHVLDGAKYAYQKMSIYVTAVVESYEYYSQCRLIARQLAIEQQGLVDEQAILISFNDAMGEQNRKELNDQRFLKKVAQHVGSESERFVQKVTSGIKTIVEQEIGKSKIMKCPVEDIEAVLLSGQGIRRFKTDVTEHFAVFSSIAKVAFYQLIQDYAVDEQMNLMTIPVSSFSLIGNYDCDELLENVRDICDEIKEFSSNNNESALQKNLNVKELKELLVTNLTKQFNSWASNIYVEPTLRITTEFLLNFRNKPQLLSMSNFVKKDCQLKMALTDYNSSKQSQKKSKLLQKALFELFQEHLTNRPYNKSLYRLVLKHGYPIPIDSAEKLAGIIHQVLVHGGTISGEPQNGKYSNGIILQIYDAGVSSEEPLHSFRTTETAKTKVCVSHADGMIFLCQTDYESYVETSELATDAYEKPPFLYEALIKSFQPAKHYFPKQQESFREAMIHFA